jgi:hypothetical protein
MIKNKLSLLALAAAVSSSVSAVEFDPQGDNFLGYKGTDISFNAAYFQLTNGANQNAPLINDDISLNIMTPMGPKEIFSTNIQTDVMDDSVTLKGIKALNKFNWGAIELRYADGMIDGGNNSGDLLLTKAFVNTPWKALKLYAGYERQNFDGGRDERHLQYGIGFGAPVLNGQLLTGYLAKRVSDISFQGNQLIDDDNGYALGLKADYVINQNWSYHFLGEYSFDRQFTEITPDNYLPPVLTRDADGNPTMPLPPTVILPPTAPANIGNILAEQVIAQSSIYEMGTRNLTNTSYKMSNKINYHVSENLTVGLEYVRMKGEAILLQNAGMAGLVVEYTL